MLRGEDQPFNVNELAKDSVLIHTIDLELYKSFFKIVQQMKEGNLRTKFASVFRITWLLVLRA